MYLRELYDLWRRMLWLRRIDKEIYRYNKYKLKMNRQRYAIKKLSDSYREVFEQGGKYETRVPRT